MRKVIIKIDVLRVDTEEIEETLEFTVVVK